MQKIHIGFNDPLGSFADVPGTIGELLAFGTTVPADATVGYAPGCLFWDVDAAAGSQLWINEGTRASSSFRSLNSYGAGRGVVLAGSTLTVTAALHRGKTIGLDQLAGSTCTLPAATGSGDEYNFEVAVLATSVSHIVKTAGTDVMTGLAFGTRIDSGNATLGFAAQSTSNTITLNRTTTGSVTLGEWIYCRDIAAGVWLTQCFLSATGAAFATPYSHV